MKSTTTNKLHEPMAGLLNAEAEMKKLTQDQLERFIEFMNLLKRTKEEETVTETDIANFITFTANLPKEDMEQFIEILNAVRK